MDSERSEGAYISESIHFGVHTFRSTYISDFGVYSFGYLLLIDFIRRVAVVEAVAVLFNNVSRYVRSRKTRLLCRDISAALARLDF